MNTLSLKDKKEEARERKKIYQREYMKNRRETDQAFAEKQREYRRICEKNKYDLNPDYRAKKSAENKERYAKYREAYLKQNAKNQEE